MSKIPKLMHQIWVGPKPAPRRWMATWKRKHPDWAYRLWGNEDLLVRKWENKRMMDYYAGIGRWDGVADLMRYEILQKFGGVVIAADSICLHPIDKLFDDGFDLYSINTGEYEGGPERPSCKGSMTPLYAASRNHWFTRALIRKLKRVEKISTPVRTTGNRYMQRMVKRHRPEIKVWPMHYFIGEHYNGWKYQGKDTVYAKHFWGTTQKTYSQGV